MTEKFDKILAEGEVTGHAHRVTSPTASVFITENPDVLELHTPDGTEVIHEEHGPVVLSPGKYERTIVKEFDPFEEEIRNVKD